MFLYISLLTLFHQISFRKCFNQKDIAKIIMDFSATSGLNRLNEIPPLHTCQPQTKKKQEIFSRGSAATIYISLPTSHQVAPAIPFLIIIVVLVLPARYLAAILESGNILFTSLLNSSDAEKVMLYWAMNLVNRVSALMTSLSACAG